MLATLGNHDFNATGIRKTLHEYVFNLTGAENLLGVNDGTSRLVAGESPRLNAGEIGLPSCFEPDALDFH